MLFHYIKLIRLNNWVKNVMIFLPAFFSGNLFELLIIKELVYSFLAFSFITSSIYILNDIRDIDEDRLHIEKRDRPLASGKIQIFNAKAVGFILLFLGFSYFLLFTTAMAFIYVVIYTLMMILYCFKVRAIAILDILFISFGFVLRLFIGGNIANVGISIWIIIMIFLLSLFLAFSKRRNDIINNMEGRVSLEGYNLSFLNAAISSLVPIIIVSYIIYCTNNENIIRVSENLYLTSFIVIIGFLRYLQLIFVNNQGGDPIHILFTDHGIQLCLFSWLIMFGLFLY